MERLHASEEIKKFLKGKKYFLAGSGSKALYEITDISFPYDEEGYRLGGLRLKNLTTRKEEGHDLGKVNFLVQVKEGDEEKINKLEKEFLEDPKLIREVLNGK